MRDEVQAPGKDAALIRALAETLRDRPAKARALRAVLARVLMPELTSAFDVFGSYLPDEAFAGVCEQPRERDWRTVRL